MRTNRLLASLGFVRADFAEPTNVDNAQGPRKSNILAEAREGKTRFTRLLRGAGPK
jgi:hypothetical protein